MCLCVGGTWTTAGAYAFRVLAGYLGMGACVALVPFADTTSNLLLLTAGLGAFTALAFGVVSKLFKLLPMQVSGHAPNTARRVVRKRKCARHVTLPIHACAPLCPVLRLFRGWGQRRQRCGDWAGVLHRAQQRHAGGAGFV